MFICMQKQENHVFISIFHKTYSLRGELSSICYFMASISPATAWSLKPAFMHLPDSKFPFHTLSTLSGFLGADT